MSAPIAFTLGALPRRDEYWTDITYGNGTFVAIGSNTGGIADRQHAATSPDGITWVRQSMPVDPRTFYNFTRWGTVLFGGGTFVAFDLNGCATSPDGVTWTRRALPRAFPTPYANTVWEGSAFVNGLFLATANVNAGLISADGITWRQVYLPALNSEPGPRAAYGNGVFVAVPLQANQSTFTRVVTSTDAATWTPRGPLSVDGNWSVAYGNGVFVAVCRPNGESRIAATSTDGVTWTERPVLPSLYWSDVIFGGGTFLALGAPYSGNAQIAASSSDGITWTLTALPEINYDYSRIAYGGGRFVVISGSDDVAVSGPVVVTAKRYLRMSQRDDGLGINRHPRLAAGNGPSSTQSGRSPRVGQGNTYR